MNAQDENQDTVQNSAYNAFPEPQTIPAGWDTSEFLSGSQPAPVAASDTSTETDANQ